MILTTVTMVWIAKRMQDKPNNVQTAVEAAYDFANNTIVRANMGEGLATKWFPFIASLFFFILFSNLIGYIPLPINTARTDPRVRPEAPRARHLRGHGQHLGPARPHADRLVLATTIEGVRAKGFFGYLKSWIPSGRRRASRASRSSASR